MLLCWIWMRTESERPWLPCWECSSGTEINQKCFRNLSLDSLPPWSSGTRRIHMQKLIFSVVIFYFILFGLEIVALSLGLYKQSMGKENTRYEIMLAKWRCVVQVGIFIVVCRMGHLGRKTSNFYKRIYIAFTYFLIYLCVCMMCVCMHDTRVWACSCQGTSVEISSLLLPCGPINWTYVIRLGNKYLFPTKLFPQHKNLSV